MTLCLGLGMKASVTPPTPRKGCKCWPGILLGGSCSSSGEAVAEAPRVSGVALPGGPVFAHTAHRAGVVRECPCRVESHGGCQRAAEAAFF